MKRTKRQQSEVEYIQGLLDELAEDVSAWQEMDQYETFLEGLTTRYDVENVEAVYEQWTRLPNGTAKQLAAMLAEAELLDSSLDA